MLNCAIVLYTEYTNNKQANSTFVILLFNWGPSRIWAYLAFPKGRKKLEEPCIIGKMSEVLVKTLIGYYSDLTNVTNEATAQH